MKDQIHATVPLIHCLDRFCIYEFMQKNKTSNSHVPVMYTTECIHKA